MGDLFFSPKTDIAPFRERLQDPEADQAQEWFPRLRTARDVKGFAWTELNLLTSPDHYSQMLYCRLPSLPSSL
ncbi:MAG TPA: hypothetical protein VEL11_18120 [Candidatus Bathyarchaeia archaeon]|nr:hypothetical protein [Candidatus Bathyarchaeia archaeon]